MEYLHWKEERITDPSDQKITDLYDQGFVFTRLGKGLMHQTRSVRINLSKFDLSSENRRILKKAGDLTLSKDQLPVADYDYSIGKMAKDFYESKFGPRIMSAQKVKEMLTDATKSNFNLLLNYSNQGYAICYSNSEILHYSYPFYNLESAPKDMGLGMMTMAIQSGKDMGLKYIYLGSLQRPGDVYKLQFSGLEWFDGRNWQTDLDEAKRLLKS